MVLWTYWSWLFHLWQAFLELFTDIFAREPTGETKYNSNEHQWYIFWNKLDESFSLSKIRLEQITLRRNVLPLASTPISTRDHKPLFNTLSALVVLHCGLRITLDNYQQHSDDLLQPELTKCSISFDLQFSNALTANLESFDLSIRSSNVFVTSDRKVTENVLPISIVWKWMKSISMISARIVNIWNISFFWVFATDNFSPHIQTISLWLWTLKIQILRGRIGLCYATEEFYLYLADSLVLPLWQYTLKSESTGTYWIVICNRRKVLHFADALGLTL